MLTLIHIVITWNGKCSRYYTCPEHFLKWVEKLVVEHFVFTLFTFIRQITCDEKKVGDEARIHIRFYQLDDALEHPQLGIFVFSDVKIGQV